MFSKSLLLPLHLSFVGIWLGCVLTEALFERALLGQGRAQELILVGLHKRVDLVVEIPAFLMVLLTGSLMLPLSAIGPLLSIKVGIGLAAVAANAYCVWLVFRRAAAANRGDRRTFTDLDHQQHQVGALVLLCIVLALALGVYLYAIG